MYNAPLDRIGPTGGMQAFWSTRQALMLSSCRGSCAMNLDQDSVDSCQMAARSLLVFSLMRAACTKTGLCRRMLLHGGTT